LGIDNKGCIDITHANGMEKLSKHIDIKYNISGNRLMQDMFASPKSALQTEKQTFSPSR
jgi:hypothetical protein